MRRDRPRRSAIGASWRATDGPAPPGAEPSGAGQRPTPPRVSRGRGGERRGRRSNRLLRLNEGVMTRASACERRGSAATRGWASASGRPTRIARVLACLGHASVVLALLACGYADSHSRDCDEGTGEHGVDRCARVVDLDRDTVAAFCEWVAATSMHVDVRCEGYSARGATFATCIEGLGGLNSECNSVIGRYERCVEAFVDAPCAESTVAACALEEGCTLPADRR